MLNLQTLRGRINASISRIQFFVLLVWCLGILLAYLVGIYVSGSIHSASRWMGAMLACSSVVVVLQKSGYKESLQVGLIRVFGTFCGALIAYLYLRLLPFTVVGMLVTVFLLEMLFMALNIYNNGHIATLTLLIIMLVSQMHPEVDPGTNCMLRFTESAAGVVVGVALLWVIEKWNIRRQRLIHRGAHSDGSPVDMDTMPLRWGHLRVVAIASLGQVTGAAISTLVGVIVPMVQLVGRPELSPLHQGVVAAAALVGIMAGSILFGRWSDRRGYLYFFRLCPALILGAALFGYLADSVPALVLALFAMGFGVGGGYSLDADYISEIMPRPWRQWMVGVAKAASAFGCIFAAAAALYLLRLWRDPSHWNHLLLLVALLALVMLATRIRFAESPGWLMAHGREAEAESAVRYFLGSDVAVGDLRRKPRRSETPRLGWGAFFGRDRLRKTLFSGIPWACEGVGVYGVGVFLPILVMALGAEDAAAGSYEQLEHSVRTTLQINFFILPGFLLGLLLIRRIYHVRLQTGGFLLAAAGLVLLLVADRLHWPAWVAVGGFMFFELFLNAGPHLVTFILPSQIYSVAERGEGAGLAAAFGKAGAVAGVFFFPLLLKWGGVTLALLVTAVLQLVGAWVTAALGRTVLPKT